MKNGQIIIQITDKTNKFRTFIIDITKQNTQHFFAVNDFPAKNIFSILTILNTFEPLIRRYRQSFLNNTHTGKSQLRAGVISRAAADSLPSSLSELFFSALVSRD